VRQIKPAQLAFRCTLNIILLTYLLRLLKKLRTDFDEFFRRTDVTQGPFGWILAMIQTMILSRASGSASRSLLDFVDDLGRDLGCDRDPINFLKDSLFFI